MTKSAVYPNVDVTSTAEAIRQIAETMRASAAQLDSIADKVVSRENLDYAGEAASVVANALLNSRLDVLVLAPIRALRDGAQRA